MSCMICVEPATSVDLIDRCLVLTCSKCGHYRVASSAIAYLDKNGWRFDVERARNWIRDQQGIGAVPIIDPQQAARLIDV